MAPVFFMFWARALSPVFDLRFGPAIYLSILVGLLTYNFYQRQCLSPRESLREHFKNFQEIKFEGDKIICDYGRMIESYKLLYPEYFSSKVKYGYKVAKSLEQNQYRPQHILVYASQADNSDRRWMVPIIEKKYSLVSQQFLAPENTVLEYYDRRAK
jgi:hypothetical protein